MGFNIFIVRYTVRIGNVEYQKGDMKKWFSSLEEEMITSERRDLRWFEEGFVI